MVGPCIVPRVQNVKSELGHYGSACAAAVSQQRSAQKHAVELEGVRCRPAAVRGQQGKADLVRLRHQFGWIVEVEAVVACITYAVFVYVLLVDVGILRAVVAGRGKSVRIRVQQIVGVQADVACIAHAILVIVGLGVVVDVGAVVAGIAHSILVAIGLIVEQERAVVAGVAI